VLSKTICYGRRFVKEQWSWDTKTSVGR